MPVLMLVNCQDSVPRARRRHELIQSFLYVGQKKNAVHVGATMYVSFDQRV